MTDLTPVASLSPVVQIETNTLVLGGTGNPANQQAQALLNRDAYRAAQIAANAAAAAAAAAGIASLRSDFANSTDEAKGATMWGYRGRSGRAHLDDFPTVKVYGAVGDGVTSDTAAFQRAIDTALAMAPGGAIIEIEAGTYWFPASDPSLDPGSGNLTFRGMGKGATILHYDEGTGLNVDDPSSKALFKNISNTPKGHLSFESLEINGTFSDGDGRVGGCPFWCDYYSSVTLRDIAIRNITQMAMDFHYCGQFVCVTSDFENISADAIRARDCPNCYVAGNYIVRNGDDAIALAMSDSVYTLPFPLREQITVVDNILVNSGQIRIAGARSLSVRGNFLRFPSGAGINIGLAEGFPVGNSVVFNIDISNNQVENLVVIQSATPGTGGAAIQVSPPKGKGSAATNGTVPGRYDSVGGGFIFPWDHNDADTSDASQANPYSHGISVKGNICRRTSKTVAAFSAYGFGSRLFQGIAYDPAITDASLRQDAGVRVTGGIWSSSIQGNILEHFKNSISLAASETNYDYKDMVISNNLLSDFTERGLVIGTNSFRLDASVVNNTFDGDTYRQSVNSNINGSYDANGIPQAINLGNVTGASVRGNSFKNVCQMVSSNAPNSNDILGNIGYCLPLALGFNVGNKGIGTIERASARYSYVVIDADPTSVNYSSLISAQYHESPSIPATGTWVAGAFVNNSAPSIDGNSMVIHGWRRLTTGSGNVAGTDWAIIRASTVSPAV